MFTGHPPKIGMRMIKSALAVFICFVIDYLRGEGIPIFSAIAAILCMQKDTKNSLTVAVPRIAGTIFGGLYGLLILYLLKNPFETGIPLLQYFIIALSTIPLMYFTVLIKEPSTTYISCVVFMSVIVPQGTDLVPYVFAFHRILDTTIGILVSLLVNVLIAPPKQDHYLEVLSDKLHRRPISNADEDNRGSEIKISAK